MNFLSEFYRGFKLIVAGLSGVSAVGAIIGGFIIGGVGGTVLIVGGSLWITTSLFTVFDAVSVHSAIAKDVKKLESSVNKFEHENTKLHGNVEALEIAKESYIEENRKLTNSVKKTEEQLGKLVNVKTEYELSLIHI